MIHDMETTGTLLIKDLEIGFGKPKKHLRSLFSGISLEAFKGELVALIGRNGVGKSTLLRTLMFIQKPLHGSISWEGKHLTDFSRHERSRTLAFVSTEPVRAGNLSVEQLVTLGRIPHTNWMDRLSVEDKQAIEAAIETVHLQTIRMKNLNEISDGERQRVMIARAIAQDTEILILDEPTAFLDLPNRVEILQLLKSLAKTQDKVVIFSTHDLNLILHEVDKIWMMTGRRVFQGSPEDLVLQDVFNRMFKDSEIRLDRKEGRFIFPQTFEKEITLRAEGDLYLWTKNALERKGFKVLARGSNMAAVQCVYKGKVPEWRLIRGSEKQVYTSIYDLLRSLF